MEDCYRNAEYLPKIIKAGKEILILSMISKQSTSGYDLIKQICAETNVFLSQGTVYPILYSFEEAGIIRVEYEKGDMRSKIYHITPPGKEIVHDEIDHLVQALNQFINLIDAEVTYPGSRYNLNNDPAKNLGQIQMDRIKTA